MRTVRHLLRAHPFATDKYGLCSHAFPSLLCSDPGNVCASPVCFLHVMSRQVGEGKDVVYLGQQNEDANAKKSGCCS